MDSYVQSKLPWIIKLSGMADTIKAADIPIVLRGGFHVPLPDVAGIINVGLSNLPSLGKPIQQAALDTVKAQLSGLESIDWNDHVLVDYSEAIIMKNAGYPNVYYPVYDDYHLKKKPMDVRNVLQVIRLTDTVNPNNSNA